MPDILSWSPRVFRLPGFLDAATCEALIALAGPRLKPSVALESGIPDKRTSHGTFLGGALADHPLVAGLRQQVAEAVVLPADHAEPLQVLRYHPGEQYQNHVDYIPPKSARAAERLAKGGQRVLTVLLYLNTVEDGGATVFPRAGLSVPARQGDAVGFYNVLPTHRVDRRSLHAGAPVVSGVKWVATLWFRGRPYGTPAPTPGG